MEIKTSLGIKLTIVTVAFAQPVASNFSQLIGYGRSIAEISNENITFILPAGYAFAIWGLIFLLCIIYACLQFNGQADKNDYLKVTQKPLLTAMFFNCVWMIIYPLEIKFLPLIIIWLIFVPLLVALRNIRRLSQSISWQNKLVKILISVFAGWLSIAAFASIAGARLRSEVFQTNYIAVWDSFSLIGAAIVALIINFKESGNWFYAGVIIWGSVAIIVKQWPRPESAATFTSLLAAFLISAILTQTLFLKSNNKFGSQFF